MEREMEMYYEFTGSECTKSYSALGLAGQRFQSLSERQEDGFELIEQ